MGSENFLKNVERRDFLKILSLTGIGSLIYSKDALASVLTPGATSTVVVVSNDNSVNTVLQTVDAAVVKVMIDDGIKTLTGINDTGNAWKSIFPGITAASVIGLKVNTLFDTKNVGTRPEVTYAVADGLTKMDFGGTLFPANNIIIFDLGSNYLETQGYTLNTSTTGVRCFATSSHAATSYNVNGATLYISNIIATQINFMVNIAQLKQHSITGLSLCMKNHLGSINDPGACHPNNGDPYLPGVCALAPIQTKQKLCIIDSLFGIKEGGPSGAINCAPKKIIMGQDIVAIDCTGRDLLLAQGMSTVYSTQASAYINTAATTYSLGNNNPANINTVNISSPITGIGKTERNEHTTRIMQNSPNPFTDNTNFHFYLESNEIVRLRVIDYSGRVITELINKKLNAGLHSFAWNGTHNGKAIKAGLYICELKAGSYNKSIIIQKIK
jgi:uncharacterized protein (DUF362 family)